MIKDLYFILTRRCNLICSHCIRSSTPHIKDQLTFDQFCFAISKLKPILSKNNSIVLSGGEPSIHSFFKECLDYAVKEFDQVSIDTNGTHFDKLNNALQNNKTVRVQISIDGCESVHDSIRGKNTFKKSMNSIKKLSENGFRVIVASVVSKKNHYSLIEFAKSLEGIPIEIWTLKREIIYGRASNQTALTTEEWNDFVTRVPRDLGYDVEVYKMFDFSQSLPKHQGGEKEMSNCGTGINKLYVNPNLTLYPCACMEEINLGDLNFDSIETIKNNFALIEPKLSPNSPCHFCPFVGICNGGCPGYSLRTFGQIGLGDSRCGAIEDLLLK